MASGDDDKNMGSTNTDDSNINESNEESSSPPGSPMSETEQEDNVSSRFPSMAAILFGNIDSDGRLTDNDFLDNETKEKLSGLSTLLGKDSESDLFDVVDDKETDEGQFEDPVNEPFKEGDKALDAQDFSNMDEAMSDDSSSSDEDESDEESATNETTSFSKPLEGVSGNKESDEEKLVKTTATASQSSLLPKTENQANVSPKKEGNLDSELMPPPPGPGFGSKTNVSPKSVDGLKEKKTRVKSGPVIKPLASMMPEKYRGIDVRTLFPEFRENQVLRFSRLFPVKAVNKPKIWKNIKRRLQKSEGELDEPKPKVSRPYTYENSFAPYPDPILPPEAYCEDQAVRFHSSNQVRK